MFYGAGVFVLVEVHNVLAVPTAAAEEAKLVLIDHLSSCKIE